MTKHYDGDPKAYERLSYELCNLHNTERDALDNSDHYYEILTAVSNGDDHRAKILALELRTAAGDAWRTKRELPFIN